MVDANDKCSRRKKKSFTKASPCACLIKGCLKSQREIEEPGLLQKKD